MHYLLGLLSSFKLKKWLFFSKQSRAEPCKRNFLLQFFWALKVTLIKVTLMKEVKDLYFFQHYLSRQTLKTKVVKDWRCTADTRSTPTWTRWPRNVNTWSTPLLEKLPKIRKKENLVTALQPNSSTLFRIFSDTVITSIRIFRNWRISGMGNETISYPNILMAQWCGTALKKVKKSRLFVRSHRICFCTMVDCLEDSLTKVNCRSKVDTLFSPLAVSLFKLRK